MHKTLTFYTENIAEPDEVVCNMKEYLNEYIKNNSGTIFNWNINYKDRFANLDIWTEMN